MTFGITTFDMTIKCDTQHYDTPRVVMLSVFFAEGPYVKCHYAECFCVDGNTLAYCLIEHDQALFVYVLTENFTYRKLDHLEH